MRDVEISGLQPHEQISLKRYREILLEIASTNAVAPIIIDKITRIIIDGHHRVAAMQTLGYKTIPAYEINMMDDNIVLEWRRERYAPDGKLGIWYRARMSEVYPYKTTRFMYRKEDGTLIRLYEVFPHEMQRLHLL